MNKYLKVIKDDLPANLSRDEKLVFLTTFVMRRTQGELGKAVVIVAALLCDVNENSFCMEALVSSNIGSGFTKMLIKVLELIEKEEECLTSAE